MKQLFAGFSIARALAFLTLAMGCASSEQTEALLSDQALEPSSRPTRRSGHFYHTKRRSWSGTWKAITLMQTRLATKVYVGSQSEYQRYRQTLNRT